MTRIAPLLFLSLLTCVGCPAPEEAPSAPAKVDLATEVAEHHGGGAWSSQQAIRGKLIVAFGKRPPLEAELLYSPSEGKVRYVLADGTRLVFDGQRAWSAPAAFPRARFHLLTWTYFLAAPFKIGDPGTHLKEVGEHALTKEGPPLRVARLTFGEDVGDTPDDWYDVYVRPDGTLEALGYIVTYGKEQEAAEKAPHACVYSDYVDVAGVQLSTKWTFYNWTRAGGLTGPEIGKVSLSDLSFVTPEAGAFDKPEGAVEDALPN